MSQQEEGYAQLPAGPGLESDEIRKWTPPRKPLTVRATLFKNKVTKAAAIFTSSGWPAFVRVALPAMNYALDPILKLKIISHFLWGFRDPCWATACLLCATLPFIAIYLLYNYIGSSHELEERREQFADAFKGPPTMPKILKMHLYVIVALLRNAFGQSKDFGSQAQCYAKLELLVTGAFGNTTWVAFQTYIFIRQHFLDRTVVSPVTLLLSVSSCAMNEYLAFSYLKDYAKIAHEGNYKSFFKNLLTLGRGMAPPMLLARIRTEREVVLDGDDLSGLDARGFMSVARSMSSSVTAESVVFENTGIQAPRGTPWYIFVDEFSFNRHTLLKVAFGPVSPELSEEEWGDFSYALRLREVKSGGRTIFTRKVADDVAKLIDAVEGGNVVRLKAEVQNVSTDVGDVEAPLFQACEWAACIGSWESLAEMLAMLPSPQRSTSVLSTLLQAASGEGQVDCMLLLLACGADVRRGEYTCPPLSLAACNGHEAAVATLLAAAADPNETDEDETGRADYTPLHHSAFNDRPGVVRALLSARADMEQKNVNGRTPLRMMAQEGALGSISKLIGARVDVNAVDNRGMSPIEGALRSGQVESVRALARAGAHLTAARIEKYAPNEHVKELVTPFATAS